MLLTLVKLLLMPHMAMSLTDLLADVQCEEDPVGYIIPDPNHCDRYLDCDPVHGRSVKLCPAGHGVHLVRGGCQEEREADCGARQIWRKQKTGPVAVRKVLTRGGSRPLAPVSADPLAALVCSQSREGYIVHDPSQCDRYAECSPHGVKTYQLCPDGLVLSLAKGVCDFPSKVDCSARPKLQPPKGRGHCLRENGKFPLPAELSCSQYVDCRGGDFHVQGCAGGAVYDEVLGCVHPDETDRPGCTAAEKYQFQCPHFGLQQRFGDHDRLPHPTDCKLYFACLRNGLPRLNSCQEPLVFNPQTGFCDEQSNVPGCEGYYREEEKTDTIDRDKITNEIREQLLKEFGLPAKSRVSRSATDNVGTVPLSPRTQVHLGEGQKVVKKVKRSAEPGIKKFFHKNKSHDKKTKSKPKIHFKHHKH